MAHIPTTIERNAVDKLEQLFDKWIKLKKSSRLVSIDQTANEAAFQADSDKLFDIAHADAMTLVKIPEDRLFLTDQRTDRKGYMSGEDKVFADKQERMKKRKTAEEKLRLPEEQRKRTYDSVFSSSMPLSIADSNTSVDAGTDAHFNAHSCPMPDSHTIKKQRPTNIISPELASALDRTNVSDRNATYLLAAT